MVDSASLEMGRVMTDGWMNSYQRNVNAETLARQTPDVQRAAAEILEEIKIDLAIYVLVALVRQQG